MQPKSEPYYCSRHLSSFPFPITDSQSQQNNSGAVMRYPPVNHTTRHLNDTLTSATPLATSQTQYQHRLLTEFTAHLLLVDQVLELRATVTFTLCCDNCPQVYGLRVTTMMPSPHIERPSVNKWVTFTGPKVKKIYVRISVF